ncbi:hypothetical protein [Clostridium sp.]|uniref:hypothetical protein n=1 Tax=Clostridium sp. TaxID=1506 RepID=UPI003F2D0ABF
MKNIEAEKIEVLFTIENCSITLGIQNLIDNNELTFDDINEMLLRHMKNDDDNKYEEDREYNLQGINNGGRVLSVYNVNNNKMYINSYIQRCSNPSTRVGCETLVMLTDEY